jgi:hypothetical protein
VAEIQGELSYYNTTIPPGLYNLDLEPVSADPSQGPGGYSYGTATVSAAKATPGAVAIVLNLADGTTPTISFPSALAQDGSCPFYASLYGGNGVILGWLQFDLSSPGNWTRTVITWLTAGDYTSKTYPSGFSSLPAINGSLYTPPKAGTNVFGQDETALTLEIDPGYSSLSLPNEIDLSSAYSLTKNTFAFASNTNKASASLTLTKGVLTGSFVDTAISRSTISFNGVVVDGAVYGFYIDTASKETGPILFGVPPFPYTLSGNEGLGGDCGAPCHVGGSPYSPYTPPGSAFTDHLPAQRSQ